MKGLVKKSTGSRYELQAENGDTIYASIKGKLRLDELKTTNPIAVGDWVDFDLNPAEDSGIIKAIHPRRNYIIRKSNNLSRQTHIIAANLDQVLIIATLVLPRTSQGFIDRLLLTCEAYRINAVIVFNKIDLFEDSLFEYLGFMTEMYQSIGYSCIPVSVKSGEGMDKLLTITHGKTSLVTGHSGVGKSSMLNILSPGIGLKTGNISGFSLKGKHTTTFAEMHVIGNDTYVIDTPGIKDFGVVEIQKWELSHYFPEMRALLGQCKFNNCLHVNEPDCAVLAALDEGTIYSERYQSYLSILNDEDTRH